MISVTENWRVIPLWNEEREQIVLGGVCETLFFKRDQQITHLR